MLLESIKLQNFRQFRNADLKFANDTNGKNVTIIIGENGTGKTTFAQAFFWCMYGDTTFTDKVILNRIVAEEMMPGHQEEVKVTLRLSHGDVRYKLVRSQIYRKERNGRIKGDNTVFDISLKREDGIEEGVKKPDCESEVKKILPQELSKYFFFDGERIEKMSKEITSGKKASEFADAVNGLLGLNAMRSAIRHFSARSSGVIASLKDSYQTGSDIKVKEYTETIKACEDRLEEIRDRLSELEEQTEIARKTKEDKTLEIKKYEDGEVWQNKKENTLGRINNLNELKALAYRDICKDFNSGLSHFFSVYMIQKSLEVLSSKDFLGKDIPHIQDDTINYLLNRKICLCGTRLDEGTIPYQRVKDLLEFVPPKSISNTVAEFKSIASTRANYPADLYEQLREGVSAISKHNDDLEECNDELLKIEEHLSGEDVREKVRAINAVIKQCDKTIHDSEDEQKDLLREEGTVIGERDRAYTERAEHNLLHEGNRKIDVQLAYANKILEKLNEQYARSEKETRDRLEQAINDIFKSIYEGGLSLTIDEKYHISVYADDYDGDVETSTAQSISVIFAFITSIIKLARENKNSSREDAELLSSEPYPLVMDAPLSAFDKKRIKTICESIPETAEQVVIFIKDTDGELAEKYMGDRIGERRRFDKKNEFETVLL